MTPADRPALVLGTAGHIDHGKTALVRALTGVDTDRLPEEKARGITIDLGFAPLDLPDGTRLGVVDVPGHEGLVRTMVAGAAGIDLVLLVVAADEGVMPQTREHLAVCTLLGLERGVVALTKSDLVDEETAELAEAEVGELLEGTGLAGAPVRRVSAATGAGLDALREALAGAAASAASRTPRAGPARLWVDRHFSAKGFGSVVTGTLTGAPLAVGDALELHPGGGRARVRGLQSFGEAAPRVAPGARCAVNLQGTERHALGRGTLLVAPDALVPTTSFDAELEWLAGAPPLGARPASVELLVGTAERRARVAALGDGVAAGARGLARIHVAGEALPLLPGDRFVVRGFARTPGAGATWGGGRVVDVAPVRRRRRDPALAAELAVLAGGAVEDGLVLRVARAGFAGARAEALARETGLDPKAVADVLARAASEGSVVALGGGRFLGATARTELAARLLAALRAFHEREPLRPGIARQALRGALPENAAPEAFERLLGELAAEGRVAVEESRVRAADFLARLTPRQEAIAARLRADAMIAGLEPPALREWQEELRVPEAELRDLLAHLERDGSLVRAPGDLWFDRVAVDELRARVVAWLREHGALETARYKELVGTSRKWAVPLMELFDAEHVTVRRGEERVLRRAPQAPRTAAPDAGPSDAEGATKPGNR